MTTPKGIRMINENLVQSGRGFVINDRSAIDWNHIPDGSIYINPQTGLMMVKLEGESDWVPAGLKNDGTIVISKDTSITIEKFTIVTLDNGDGTFTYKNTEGQNRTKVKDTNGFVFELEKGTYMPGRNHLTVIYDDVLERSAASGGVIELDETRFKFTELSVPVGTELTVKYIKWVRIGNPYPRIFMSETEPPSAEVGDWFLDYDDEIGSFTSSETDVAPPPTVTWNNVSGRPTTLAGYGITDQLANKIHYHTKSDITDFPTTMTANGGNADYATRAELVGTSATVTATFNNNAANSLLKLGNDGKVPDALVNHPIIFSSSTPTVQDNKLWVQTTNPPKLYVGISGAWKAIASFYS